MQLLDRLRIAPAADAAPRDSLSSVPKFDTRLARDSGLDAAFERKLALVNAEIRALGFGRFQWWMFYLAGAGWAVDNIIFQALGMTLPQVRLEFRPQHVQFLTLALYTGLLVGAFFWGFGADVVGRRFAWNSTLFLGSVFMVAVGAAPNFVGMAALLACAGVGIGGNLPVDGSLLLEFLPGTKQWLLTFLSVFWCLGQLFAALIGWAFITNYRCDALPCPRESNMGWRYTWFLVGGVTLLLWLVRFWLYPIPESPKYLIGKGCDAEAIAVLDFIARENGRENSLTLEMLRAAEHGFTETASAATHPELGLEKEKEAGAHDAAAAAPEPVTPGLASDKGAAFGLELANLKRSLKQFDGRHVRMLFYSPRMTLNTCLICLCWGVIGIAYPLYNSFIALYIGTIGDENTSQAEQYRQLVIIAACGIPGSLIASVAVELPYLGRRFSMAFFTMLTGLCLFLFTTASTSSAVLGWNCGASLAQNAMYGVLYHLTYELFPSPCRGTGDGLAMGVQRIFGISAPLIAAYASSTSPTAPVFVSASLFLFASLLMLLLPYETRGVEAL